MKKVISSLFCLLILFAGACKSDKPETSDNKIIIGTIDSLYSKILNEERNIWVYVPEGNALFARQKFPVVYLLDGGAHFYSVMGMIQQLSEVNGNMILPQMILVGIPNTNRTRDLTPTHAEPDAQLDSAFMSASGGGEAFTSFIEKELVPYVDSVYPALPYRTFIGHSLGGLLVINTLINHTKLFNAYLSIDPSIWWDNKRLLDQAKDVLNEKDFSGTTFYLAVANTMAPGLDTSKVLSDTTAETRHIRSVLELSRYLRDNNKNNLKNRSKYYESDSHGSVPLIAEYDALRYIFSFYEPEIDYSRMKDPSYNIDSVINKYSEVLSENFGFAFPPPEAFINMMGYNLMSLKLYDKAFSVFEINIKNYPKSANVYDSMGELLMNKGDTVGAIENYEKSLALFPGNDNAKEMIRKMKE